MICSLGNIIGLTYPQYCTYKDEIITLVVTLDVVPKALYYCTMEGINIIREVKITKDERN